MSIERKFKMFSTKEWIQYLQYKLSQEREKELESQLAKDPFLSETIATIGDKENRAVAFQSISLLISEVEQYTGVSESKIMKSKDAELIQPSTPINWKLIGIILGGLFFIGLFGYGIYYFISSNAESDGQEQSMVEAESVSNIQSYADSSSMPMEIIPNSLSAASTPVDTSSAILQKPAQKKPANQNTSSLSGSSQANPTPTKSTTESSSASSAAAASQRERELFNQAQEEFKKNNREEAKRILRELKSYDNPMKSQAETILKNIEN